MIVEPVFGDLGDLTSFELLGTCGDAIIVGRRGQRRALDRVTGCAIDLLDEVDPIAPTGELVGGGVRVKLVGRDLVRVHADWIEQVEKLPAKTQLVTIGTLAVAISRGSEAFRVRILETSGPIVHLSLPSWLGTRAIALAGPRVLAFVSPKRISWLRYETIEELHRRAPQLSSGVVRVIPPGASRGDGFVTVVRGGRANAVVEGTNGARIFLGPQYAEVEKGDRLEIRLANGELALFDARDRMVAKQDSISMVRTVKTATTDAPHETTIGYTVSPGSIARSKITPGVLARLDRLHELGLAPERAAVDAAILSAFSGPEVEIKQPAIAAAKLLYVHYQHQPDDSRALVGKDAIARAPRDWHLVTMADYEPFAIRLDDHQQKAIVDEDLLLLEPLPPVVAPPSSADEVRAQLIALIAAAPDDVVLEARKGRRFALRLSIRAAALLDQRAGYPR